MTMPNAPRPAPDSSDDDSSNETRMGSAQAGNAFLSRRLRLAGVLIIAGIVVEGLSLVWNHPLSFLAFVGIGGLAVVLGIALYLFALVSPRQS